jgi:threonine/homoserine/homoserine lactone efflux protein
VEPSVSYIVAALAGLIFGFAACVPIGPVNITVIHQALRRGFRAAFLTGLGAITGESVYAGLALAGHSKLPHDPTVLFIVRIVAVGVVITLGIRNLRHRPDVERSERIAERIDERYHHPRALLLGFLMTITNLGLFILWATLTAILFAHGWVDPVSPSRAACLAGVFSGGLLWYFGLATVVGRAHRSIRPETISFLIRICGGIFLLVAVLLLYKIIRP